MHPSEKEKGGGRSFGGKTLREKKKGLFIRERIRYSFVREEEGKVKRNFWGANFQSFIGMKGERRGGVECEYIT